MSQQSRQQGMGGVPTGQGLTMQQQQQGDGYLYREMGSVRSEQPQPPGTGVEMLLHEEPYNAERIMEVNSTGRYAKLNVLLGKGAYKVVYKGIDREEGYEVAWNTAQTSKAEFMELSQEIEILKRVRHSNIIQFHDYWYNNTEFVFITELMTSGTLREYIKKLQIPNLRIVKRWSRQILKGLAYLHSHVPPIIHRDIKCDNIFINGAHGEVKIGDMGSAKMKRGKKYTVIGTPEFMAPEMYEEKGYSEKVDIYAFGMSILEMVTGEYPYNECKNAAQIYKKVSQGLKPDCLARVQDPEVLDLITSCIGNENDRLSAQQIVDHPFLAVEPEVVLLSRKDNKNHLSLQVVFRGQDKLSVKFEFNVDTDTAEEVVNEMIQEQVLPAVHKRLITSEINTILREINDNQSWAEKERYSLNRNTSSSALDASGGSGGNNDLLRRHHSLKSRSPPLDPMMTGSGSGLYHRRDSSVEDFPDIPVKEYPDSSPIEELVTDTAVATNRGMERVNEWLSLLRRQDIMNVGDLRGLHDEDWVSLGLTVFAKRALKNSLLGRMPRIQPTSGGTTLATGMAVSPRSLPRNVNPSSIAAMAPLDASAPAGTSSAGREPGE